MCHEHEAESHSRNPREVGREGWQGQPGLRVDSARCSEGSREGPAAEQEQEEVGDHTATSCGLCTRLT